MTEKITLVDGSELECFPRALRPNIIADVIARNASGDYIQIGNAPKREPTPKEIQEERNKNHELFYKNVHLFLANADRILSDSRLFLAEIRDCVTYLGPSGLRRPTLGVYIEWWLYHKDTSIDANGNPIWYIGGLPMRGCNDCCSVDRKGKTCKSKLNGKFSSFSSAWSSFMDVNTRYSSAKDQYIAFSLQEVVEVLQGVTDPEQLFKIHLRLEKVKCDNYIANLKKALTDARNTAIKYKSNIQKMLVSLHREQIEAYYHKCLNLNTCSILAHQDFLERRSDLRKQLRNGTVTEKEYSHIIHPIRKRDLDFKRQLLQYRSEALRKILGDDAEFFDFNAIESILTLKNDNENQ